MSPLTPLGGARTEELYARLRTLPTVVPEASATATAAAAATTTAAAAAAAADPRIAYDVYRPDRSFAKRAPPPVAFRVVIQAADAPPPDAHATVRLFAEAAGVPLKVAVVHSGSVAFYAWVNLRLPNVANPLIPTERHAADAAAMAPAASAPAAAGASLNPPEPVADQPRSDAMAVDAVNTAVV
jgi:hypothetical protein